jgi:uncharacterized protein YecT (DUF1311 family)
MHKTLFAPAVIGALLAVSAATAADDPFRYYKAGLSTDVWGLAYSTFAPWVTDFKDQPRDPTKLVPGESTIVFRAERIETPEPFGCAKPKYEFKTITADKLFGGRLETPAREDLGFDAKDIVVLDTGCGMNVYFIDLYKAVFGIGGRLYVIERNPPPSGRADDRDRMQACMKLVADNNNARGPIPEPFLSEMPTPEGRLEGASVEARFELTSCVGAIAFPCIAKQNDDGGRIACYDRERAIWDERLNNGYKRLIAKSEPAIAASYRKIQRAWIAYRDARCAHPQIEFQGSMAGPMEAFCLMQTTADQSHWLGTGED